MSSEHDPYGDEPTARTRQTLWRLRARLVTPVEEGRVDTDMQSILSAAAATAHEVPDADATPRPGALPVGGATHAPASDDAATPIAALGRVRRRTEVVQQLGRVAAVAVLVAAVGGGAAVARDGDVSLQALLSRVQPDEPDASAVAAPPTPAPADVAPEGTADVDGAGQDGEPVAPQPEPDPLDGLAGALLPDTDVPSTAPAPTGDEGATDVASGEDDTTTTTDGGAGSSGASEDRRPTDPSSGATEGSSRGSSGSSGSGDTSRTSDGSSDDGSDAASEPEPGPTTDEVLAAPAPGDLSGAGGPQPCSSERVRDCLPSEDDDGTAADDDTPQDTEDAREELAERRSTAAPADED